MSRYVAFVSWEQTPHLSDDAKREMLEAIPPHQRDARTKGIPSLGSGAIYPVAEDDVVVKPFEFPPWYKHVYALDVGWNRTAALWGAINPEDDILYLYSEHYRGQAEPPIHAAAIQSRGKWIPGVIDPAAGGRSQHDGEKLLETYQQLGLTLTPADNSVESGIYRVWTRLSSGRLKVFGNLQNFLAEYRLYRRDEKGKIVKVNDHLMDCARYLCASGIQLAAPQPYDRWGSLAQVKAQPNRKHSYEYDPFAASWGEDPAGKSPYYR